MTYSQMLRLGKEAQLSPEKMAAILGVSGMTLRRWESMPPGAELPVLYERAFETGVEQLVVDGYLDPESALARSVMMKSRKLPFMATIKTLGVSEAVLKSKGDASGALMRGLSEIGAPESRIKTVNESKKKISAFAKLDAEWKKRVDGMLSVIRSTELTLVDKLVAYGALFYLLTPFDLIPDTIPVFGLLDDYAILGLALLYYTKRFPHIFARRKAAAS